MKSLTLLILSALFFISCNQKNTTTINANITEIEFTKHGELSVFGRDKDSLLKDFDIEIAESEFAIQTGLMYRSSMKDNQGMLFIFPDMQMRSFFMKNTRIPLDIIYIDNNKRVVSIQENAIPFDQTSLPSTGPAKYVLEINGGLSKKLNITPGSRVEWKSNNQ